MDTICKERRRCKRYDKCGRDFLPKYTQIYDTIVFIVLVKGSMWIIFHKKIQISYICHKSNQNELL